MKGVDNFNPASQNIPLGGVDQNVEAHTLGFL